MRRAPVRLAVPALMLLAAAACGPTHRSAAEAEKADGRPRGQLRGASCCRNRGVREPGAIAETPPAGAPGATQPAAAGPAGNAVAGATAAAPSAARPPGGSAVDQSLRRRARAAEAAPAPPRPAPVRMVTVPADTQLRVSLVTAVASDTSAVEDRVTGSIVRDVIVDGEPVIPAGSRVKARSPSRSRAPR